MPNLLFYNYPALTEHSMEYVNVHHMDVDGLDDGLYHPHVAGFDYCHQVMAKY